MKKTRGCLFGAPPFHTRPLLLWIPPWSFCSWRWRGPRCVVRTAFPCGAFDLTIWFNEHVCMCFNSFFSSTSFSPVSFGFTYGAVLFSRVFFCRPFVFEMDFLSFQCYMRFLPSWAKSTRYIFTPSHPYSPHPAFAWIYLTVRLPSSMSSVGFQVLLAVVVLVCLSVCCC